MPSKKKPWRTIVLTGDTGRFTWEQLHEVVRKAVVREEASGARGPKSASGKPRSRRVAA
jgi:hypothetical protein